MTSGESDPDLHRIGTAAIEQEMVPLLQAVAGRIGDDYGGRRA
jgi:hypothetical protein